MTKAKMTGSQLRHARLNRRGDSIGQINLFQEIAVDLFAGGGGASTGYELATGRVMDIAINHSADAILMHRTNHPHTEHYQADVFEVDPRTATRGRPVAEAVIRANYVAAPARISTMAQLAEIVSV